MQTYNLKIEFLLDDDEVDIKNIQLIVPEDVTISDIEKILNKSHDILCNYGIDENDESYGKCETCSNYGRGIPCSKCIEGSEYEYYGEDLYGTIGKTPETLLDYICNKYGWKWQLFNSDIEIELF